MTWKKQCPCITDLGKSACECRKVEKRIECKKCKYPLDQNFRLINEWLEKLVLSPEDLDWEEYRKSKGERIRSDNAYLFEEILG